MVRARLPSSRVDRPTAEVLRRNVSALVTTSAADTASVVGEPVARALLRGTGEPYDLVLADPPYAMAEEELADVLALLVPHGWLAADAMVVVERSSRSPQPLLAARPAAARRAPVRRDTRVVGAAPWATRLSPDRC